MTQESIEILAEMGFNVRPKLNVPASLEMNMQLTVLPLGSVNIVFCNGGQDEYDTLVNHGALRRNVEQKSVCAGCVPYLTLPKSRLASVFNSIARMRVLVNGNKESKRKHQKIANQTAKDWLAGLKREDNQLYAKEIAMEEIAETAIV